MEPKVSIIVPVYNATEHLHECMSSLLSQTYTNYEVICINDGSTDDSGAILESWETRSQKVQVIHQENLGVSIARNVGLRHASGQYIMFCDADDFFDRCALSLCINSISENDCCGVLFNCVMFDQNSDLNEGIDYESVFHQHIPEIIDCAVSEYPGIFTNICFGCFSRKIIDKHQIVFKPGRLYEDWEFISHYLAYADKMLWLDMPLYHYRWNQRKSNSSVVTRSCLDIFKAISEAKQHYAEANMWENIQYLFYYKALKLLYYFVDEKLPAAGDEVRELYMRSIKQFIDGIPFSMLLSICSRYPLRMRLSVLLWGSKSREELERCVLRPSKEYLMAGIKRAVKAIIPLF